MLDQATLVGIVTAWIPKLEAAFKQSSPKWAYTRAAGEKHMELILDAMTKSGVDPASGRYGVWKKLSSGAPSFLKKTGRLRHSLFLKAYGDSMTWNVTSTLPYASIHNDGLPNEEGIQMPKREFLVTAEPWKPVLVGVGVQAMVAEVVRLLQVPAGA